MLHSYLQNLFYVSFLSILSSVYHSLQRFKDYIFWGLVCHSYGYLPVLFSWGGGDGLYILGPASCTVYSIYVTSPRLAVQNERQPRNTATIRPESLKDMDAESILREASVAVGAFG
jgi:hypothetical protein